MFMDIIYYCTEMSRKLQNANYIILWMMLIRNHVGKLSTNTGVNNNNNDNNNNIGDKNK